MRLYLVLILLVFFCFNCDAQKRKKLKLIYAAWDESINAPVIPDNIFSLNADGLIFPRHRMFKGKNVEQSFNIFWPSPIIDGESLLIITGKQIILTTSHSNPNPDFLYWFVDITKEQYHVITTKLNSANSFDEYGAASTDRELHYKYFVPEDKNLKGEDSNYKRYLNAKNIIQMFNKGQLPGDKITFPKWEKFRKREPLITAEFADELNGYIIKY